MASKTVVKDLGESAIRRAVAELKRRPHVKAGILDSAGPHDEADGLSVAQVAIINEFGTATIPERAAFRTAAAELTPKMVALQARLVEQLASGTITVDRALDTVGLTAVAVIKRTIRDWTRPPNAPSTIRAKARQTGRAKIARAKRKGGDEAAAAMLGQYDNPLEDTGQMRESVNYKKETGA